MKPLPLLAKIADAEAGACEEPRGSNRGPQIAKYFAADDYRPNKTDDGYPWCAAFVCWCVQELARKSPAGTLDGITLPRTARAFGLIDWAKKQNGGCLVFSPAMLRLGALWPQAGDIAVFEFSHCGIILASAPRERNFTCVEGNTDRKGSREGWEVARRPRVHGLVRAFIRIIPQGGKEL